jgi:hypothetical protein
MLDEHRLLGDLTVNLDGNSIVGNECNLGNSLGRHVDWRLDLLFEGKMELWWLVLEIEIDVERVVGKKEAGK